MAWAVGVVLAGFFFGSHIPGIDTCLLPIIALVVVISPIPMAIEVVHGRRRLTVASVDDPVGNPTPRR